MRPDSSVNRSKSNNEPQYKVPLWSPGIRMLLSRQILITSEILKILLPILWVFIHSIQFWCIGMDFHASCQKVHYLHSQTSILFSWLDSECQNRRFKRFLGNCRSKYFINSGLWIETQVWTGNVLWRPDNKCDYLRSCSTRISCFVSLWPRSETHHDFWLRSCFICGRRNLQFKTNQSKTPFKQSTFVLETSMKD